MSDEKSNLQDLKDLFVKSGLDEKSMKIALSAIWTQDELPEIENDAQYEEYRRLQAEIERSAPSKHTMERGNWHHTNDGILWGAYAVKIHEWEQRNQVVR